jgi:hypothetical protein
MIQRIYLSDVQKPDELMVIHTVVCRIPAPFPKSWLGHPLRLKSLLRNCRENRQSHGCGLVTLGLRIRAGLGSNSTPSVSSSAWTISQMVFTKSRCGASSSERTSRRLPLLKSTFTVSLASSSGGYIQMVRYQASCVASVRGSRRRCIDRKGNSQYDVTSAITPR